MDLLRNGNLLDKIDLDERIDIIGLGASGSFVATTLVRTGFRNLWLHDFDKIEKHNICNQDFTEDQIGISKITATVKNIMKINKDVQWICNFEAITKSNIKEKLGKSKNIFMCADSMECRRLVYDTFQYDEINLIESRLDYTGCQIYSCITPEKRYRDCLNHEGGVAVSACGSPVSICVTSQLAASTMVSRYIQLKTSGIVGECLISLDPPQLMYNGW